MTYKEIQDEVFIIVKDSTQLTRIPAVINDAYQEIVNEVHIPALKIFTTVGTVVGQSYCNLPDRVTGSLLYVGSVNGKINKANNGLAELLDEDPTLSAVGDVEKVALEGTVLWYIKQPETVTDLYILIYQEPAPMVADGNIPSVLPSYLHRQLLVYKSAYLLYNEIEDGMDGEKVNTAVYKKMYEDGKILLLNWLAKQRSHMTKDIWSV